MAEPGSLGEVYARNRAGDLDYVPVEQPDTSTWLERVYGMLKQGGWQDPQPGQRGTFVPGKVGDDGKVSAAVPGIIQQPAEGLQSLMTAPLGDIVRSGDRDAMRAASEASFDVASMLPAAGVAAGRTIPEGAAGIFGGRLAKTADQTALKRAEDMAAKGAPREQIWQDTGWFKGVDGKWRFEIDDSKSTMASDFKIGDLAPLPEALQHPDLYRAYDMSRVTAERVPGPSSMIFDDNMQIGGKSSNDARLGGLHEAQHRVQKEEGFARGGSPQSEGRIDPSNDPTVASRQRVFDSLKEAHADALDAYTAALREPTPVLFGRKQHETKIQQLKERVDRIAEQRAAAHLALMEAITVAPNYDDALGWSRYNRLAGEVEARTTQSRADLTPEQRRARPPWLDYDVPENQQIVRLASNADDPTTAAILATMNAQDKPKGITAYHGSPHDFDRFDMSKIGTGEGAQAYGHGLYFAEAEDVAKTYRENLTRHPAQQLLDRYGGDIDAAIQDARRNANTSWGRNNPDALPALEAHKRGEPLPPSGGRLYEVRINADPADFLDWDKPLSQQSEKVRESIRRVAEQADGYDKFDNLAIAAIRGEHPRSANYMPTGEEFLRDFGSLSDPSKSLREAGIPGIRYLDQGSRVAGEGSRNYVVFDDKLVEILKKYSNPNDPTTAAILALLTAQQGGPQQQ